jgi:hypothetical protein
MDKYKDKIDKLIGKYERGVKAEIKEDAAFIAENTPDQLDKYATVVGKYKGDVARKISKQAREIIEYLDRTKGTEVKPLVTLGDYLDRMSNNKITKLIGKYEHEWAAKQVVESLASIAAYRPEELEQYMDLMGNSILPKLINKHATKNKEAMGVNFDEGKQLRESVKFASRASRFASKYPEELKRLLTLTKNYKEDQITKIIHCGAMMGTQYKKSDAFDNFFKVIKSRDGDIGGSISSYVLGYTEDIYFMGADPARLLNLILPYDDSTIMRVLAIVGGLSWKEGQDHHASKNSSSFIDYLENSKDVNEAEVNKIPWQLEERELEKLKDEKGTLKDKNKALGLYRSLKDKIDISLPSISKEWQSEIQGIIISFLKQNYPLIPDYPSIAFSNALNNQDFIQDIIGFTSTYEEKGDLNAIKRLNELVLAYAKYGNKGIRGYKSTQRNNLTVETREVLQCVNNYEGNSKSKKENLYSNFENTIENLRRHIQENGDISKSVANPADIDKHLEKISNLSQKVKTAFSGGIESLIDLQKKSKGKTKKEADRAIGLYKKIEALKDVDALETANIISDEVELASDMKPKEVGKYLDSLKEKYSSELNGLEFSLKNIQRTLEEKGKPASTIASDLVGVINGLKNHGKSEDKEFTAKISHDFSKLLTIGRYGNSGNGNCQQFSQRGWYNLSLMGFIGDSNEEIIILSDSDGEMTGFVNLHGIKVNGEDGFLVERVYTNLTQSTSQMESAVTNLIESLKTENLRFFRVDGAGKEVTVEVSPSIVPRYLDSLAKERLQKGGKAEVKLVEL